MGRYVILSRLTDEGAKTVKDNPERIKEVNKELEKMGVKVLEQYVVLGPYDFVNIVEAPDALTVAKAMTELSSRGTVRTMSMPAIPVDEYIKSLKK
ncbi:MAG: GYD domain-containing protein [Candidatus Jordarchaeales archaeon]